MRILIIIALISLFISGCNKTTDWKKGILAEEFIYEKAPFPSCHAATIVETPTGIAVAWFGGTYERNPDVGIWFSRKVEDKWTSPVEVANGVMNDTLRFPGWNPVLYQVPGGDLLLFYKVGPRPDNWKGVMKTSSDGGITWSKPDSLGKDIIGPVKNKPVLLENGTLISGSSTEGDGWKIHLEISADKGKTWELIGPISDAKTYEAIQPSVLNHGNGKLQILCRTRNAVVAESWSKDYGRTWTLLQATQLPNNNSGTDAVTLKDGRQLVVYNHVKTPINAKKGYRTPLNVAISDDGIVWNASLILEDSEIGEYSYPAVIQSSDGLVHIVYTWRREKIKHVVIDPGKLNSKKIINEKWPI